MLEVSLLIRLPKNWIGEALKFHNTVIRITDVKSEGAASGVQDFVEISTDRAPDELMNRVKANKNVIRSDLQEIGGGRLAGAVTTDGCPVCSAISGVGCSLVTASSMENESILWELIVTDNAALGALLGRLSSSGVSYEVKKKKTLTNRRELTLRQEEILKMAFELGYFDFPKKIKLDKLSKRLDISPSTLAEILHRAEKHILTKHFRGERKG